MQLHSLTILGSSAALPSYGSAQTSQALNINGHTFIIDCGENTQSSMLRYGVNQQKLTDIFISHLHGDHCFGLIGLISTLDLLGRRGDINVHSHPGLEAAIRPMLDLFCSKIHFSVNFIPFTPFKSEVIYENNTITVTTIPLSHSIPASGFLFKEKPKELHINKQKVDFYHIPVRMMQYIKKGEDFVQEDGTIIPNKELTLPASPSRSYAYISDTEYTPKIAQMIDGADLLFHEATFISTDHLRAKQTKHSTAEEAASFAKQSHAKKLIIGHFSARYKDRNALLNEAKSIFPNTELALDGKSFSF